MSLYRIVPNAHLILASGSPRRREMLTELGLDFDIIPSSFDEESVAISDPQKLAESLSHSKASVVSQQYPQAWVIGADSVVALGDELYAKPLDPQDAMRMIQTLSGQTHSVISGLTLLHAERKYSRTLSSVTQVTMRELSEDECARYVATGEPMDKAGGYGIQGAAAPFIARVEGSYTNVVGLDLNTTVELLLENKVIEPRARSKNSL